VSRFSRRCWNLSLSQTYGPSRLVTGIVLPFYLPSRLTPDSSYRNQLPNKQQKLPETSLGLPSAFTMITSSAYSTLKMEVICFSETSVDFQTDNMALYPRRCSLHKTGLSVVKLYSYLNNIYSDVDGATGSRGHVNSAFSRGTSRTPTPIITQR
jgi:hypothetical protein